MLRYPTSRSVSRTEVVYVNNVTMGKEENRRYFPLFMTAAMREELSTRSRRFLEEDRTWLPLRTLGAVTTIEDLVLLCAPENERWSLAQDQVKASYDGSLWDVDASLGGTSPLGYRIHVDLETGRADEIMNPRIPSLRHQLESWTELPASVCVRDGPIILALHEAVIPITNDLKPRLGIAREIFRTLPELKDLIQGKLGKTRVGDTIICTLRTGTHKAHLWLPIVRESTGQLPCRQPYNKVMDRIHKEAQSRGVRHLVVIRPPGKPFEENWDQVARYYSGGFWNTRIRGVLMRGIPEKGIRHYPGIETPAHDVDQECPGESQMWGAHGST